MSFDETIQVLIVEDDPAHTEMICRHLEHAGNINMRETSSLEACLEAIATSPPDIILIDLHLPDGGAIDLLPEVAGQIPVITLTSRGSEEQAVEVLKAGALDYLTKSSQTFAAMPRIVERALREWRLQREKEQALAALQSSEQRFRMLLENVQSVAVQGYRPDGTIFYWNRASEDLYGYAAAEAIGKNLLELVIPLEQRVTMYKSLEETTKTGLPSGTQEMTVRHKDGSSATIYSSSVVVNRDDRPAETYCFDVDISARKKVEDLLREQKSLTEAMLQNTATPIFVIDPQHRVLVWNKACEELTGVKAAEVVGTNRHWSGFYAQERPCLVDIVLAGNPPDLLAELYPEHSHSELLDEGLQAEGWRTGSDGEPIYLTFNAALVRDSHGTIIAAIETLQDITPRKKIEDELRTSRAELLRQHEKLDELFKQVEQTKQEWEATLDCMDDIVILTDNNGKVIRCNSALAKLIDVPASEVLNRPWYELIGYNEDTDTQEQEPFREFFHQPTQRWLLISIYPYSKWKSSDTTGQVIALHDLTAIKKVSAELEQANRNLKVAHVQQLQSEKMASIGQLAAGVAHEINNPIGFVSSNLGTLEKYIAKLHEFISFQSRELESHAHPERREQIEGRRNQLKIDMVLEDINDLLAESREGVERVGKIVRDLKGFSRVDEAEYKMADIIECLESAVNIAWNEIKYKATLNRDFAELPHILCYPGQLNQVFVNLLVNSAQAIDTQGTIELQAWEEDDQIYIQVRDNGCGISEENCKRIFDPFFTTKEVGKGTGLGLSISYDIIEKHRGEISVASREGEGTSFTIKLPIKPDESIH